MGAEGSWSTKEQLAIASYVLRSGEQQWLGVGRLLEQFAEPGKTCEWFRPEKCAEQYNALLQKFGEVNNNTAAFAKSPEEIIVSRLTDLRIDELNTQLLREDNEYLELEKQIQLLDSGALDDKLDNLLNDYENSLNDSDVLKEENESGQVNTDFVNNTDAETVDQEIAEEVRLQIEKLQESSPTQLESEALELTKDSYVIEHESKFNENSENVIFEEDAVSSESTLVDSCESSCDSKGTPVFGDAGIPIENKPNMIDSGEPVIEYTETRAEKVAKKKDAPTSDAEEYEVRNKNTTDNKDNAKAVFTVESIDINLTVGLEKSRSSLVDGVTNDDQSADPNSAIDDFSYAELIEENESICNEVPDDMEVDQQSKTEPEKSSAKPTETVAAASDTDVTEAYRDIEYDADESANWKAWKKSIMILWKEIVSHRYASLFMQPVTDDIAPNYSTTVYRTTDLSTIKKNIEIGIIQTTSEFQRDLMLMFQNAIMYNNKEHDVYKMATEMQMDVMDQVAQFLATQIMVDTEPKKSGRRHSKVIPPGDHVFATSDMLLSVLVGEARSKRVAAIEGEARFMRKKQPSHET
uniref:bromodomain-containing protein 8-like n=1 Tax=Styela clava TaxID=7725 RepID=UPI00193AA243|nr:bromodomain-containing protein 8-like [Styela clava]